MKSKLEIPGPRSMFGPLGMTYLFFKDPIKFLDKSFKKYGNLIGVHTAPMATPPKPGYPGTVFLYGHELIKEVSLDYDSFYRSAMSHRLFPEGRISHRQKAVTKIMTGLTSMQKISHKRQRGMISPLLNAQSVKNYFSIVHDVSMEAIESWKVGEVIDISEQMLNITLKISSRTIFGRKMEQDGIQLGLLVEDWIRFVMSPGHLLPYDFPVFPYHYWLNLTNEIEKKTRILVANFIGNSDSGKTLLTDIIEAKDEKGVGISSEDLIGHVSLLMWGSRDAVANAIVWTLFLLTQHPHVYKNVVDEVKEVLKGSPPQLYDLEKLPYLTNVIKESLRLFPPFPVTHRVVGKERKLKNYTLPVRTEIGMSVYHTNRISDIYPNPLRFNPERWDTSDKKYLPLLSFGMGPRGCIGYNFGWQEMLTIISIIIQKFHLCLLPNKKINRNVKVALIPEKGLPIVLSDLGNNFSKNKNPVDGNINEMVELES